MFPALFPLFFLSYHCIARQPLILGECKQTLRETFNVGPHQSGLLYSRDTTARTVPEPCNCRLLGRGRAIEFHGSNKQQKKRMRPYFKEFRSTSRETGEALVGIEKPVKYSAQNPIKFLLLSVFPSLSCSKPFKATFNWHSEKLSKSAYHNRRGGEIKVRALVSPNRAWIAASKKRERSKKEARIVTRSYLKEFNRKSHNLDRTLSLLGSKKRLPEKPFLSCSP